MKEGGGTDSDRLVLRLPPLPGAASPRRRSLRRCSALLHRETKRFATGTADPWELAVDKPEEAVRLPADATPAQLAGWTVVARVLLNLDETITKE